MLTIDSLNLERSRPRKPDFFIVGAPKCGTSAMYEYLRQHPDVFVPRKKEPHFFGSNLNSPWFMRDKDRYEALFAFAREESRVGEASVWYLYSKVAANEIKEFSPGAQAIIMLRNPVDMMYSNHSQFLYNGNEDIVDFRVALEAEGDRRQGKRIPSSAHLVEGLLYRQTAMYAEQVERYVEVFGWDSLHIIIYDDFKEDPAGTYRKLLRFLGVDEDFRPQFKVINPNKRVRSKALRGILQKPPKPVHALATSLLPRPLRHELIKKLGRANIRHEERSPMDSGLRRRLQRELAPEVKRLSELLGRDLTHWSRD